MLTGEQLKYIETWNAVADAIDEAFLKGFPDPVDNTMIDEILTHLLAFAGRVGGKNEAEDGRE
jgi:hypothetical protein